MSRNYDANLRVQRREWIRWPTLGRAFEMVVSRVDLPAFDSLPGTSASAQFETYAFAAASSWLGEAGSGAPGSAEVRLPSPAAAFAQYERWPCPVRSATSTLSLHRARRVSSSSLKIVFRRAIAASHARKTDAGPCSTESGSSSAVTRPRPLHWVSTGLRRVFSINERAAWTLMIRSLPASPVISSPMP